jgi:hypothetical protein
MPVLYKSQLLKPRCGVCVHDCCRCVSHCLT